MIVDRTWRPELAQTYRLKSFNGLKGEAKIAAYRANQEAARIHDLLFPKGD